MENWKDNNLSAILEYPFDFERYIEERLREIDDLDERQFAKKLLSEGLGRSIKCMEKKYKDLERRIYEEKETPANQYEVVMTVIHRKHYDPANGTLFPVMEEDFKEKALAEALSSETEIFLGTVFLKMDEKSARAFQESGSFSGTFFLGEEETETLFSVRPAVRYRERVEQIYQIFQDNHVPWETMNTAYLDRFYDVFTACPYIAPGNVTLAEVNLNLGEYSHQVCYGMIPLWNMEWIRFNSTDFMNPSIDGIYYEHVFSLRGAEEKDGYLIQSNEDILEIRHEEGKIVIKSKKGTFEGWKALHILQGQTVRSPDYDAPFLTNRKKDSFIRRYAVSTNVQLMTKTDLFRRIMELDIREYIEVTGYEIHDNAREFPAVEGMNWFVRDELFPMESRKVLLLKFEGKKPGYFLNDSMVRFVISQMQLEIGEYRCVGVIT